jgi:protein gp37
MSYIFHEDLSDEIILELFSIMNRAYWHTFQVLTKREKRINLLNERINWSDNIWLGVSVENSDYAYRIDNLRESNARVKFLSIEPLLGPIPNMDLANIDWVIVGGESGPHSRPIQIDWVRSIRDQCVLQSKLFFFKQWGGTNKKKNGRVLDGQIWDQKPLRN